MTKRYEPRRMTEREQKLLEQVLFEQMDVQRWFAVVVLKGLIADIMVPLN